MLACWKSIDVGVKRSAQCGPRSAGGWYALEAIVWWNAHGWWRAVGRPLQCGPRSVSVRSALGVMVSDSAYGACLWLVLENPCYVGWALRLGQSSGNMCGTWHGRWKSGVWSILWCASGSASVSPALEAKVSSIHEWCRSGVDDVGRDLPVVSPHWMFSVCNIFLVTYNMDQDCFSLYRSGFSRLSSPDIASNTLWDASII